MGVCHSNAEDTDANRQVDKELLNSKSSDKQVKKLLLLGAGSSGKTTFFKQLKRIHGDGFSRKDRIDYRAQILSQIIECMQKLIWRGRELIDDYGEDYEHLKPRSQEAEDAAASVELLRRETSLTHDMCDQITILWRDEGIRNTFELRARLAIPDSCSHFFDSMDRIGEDDYMPTDDDILYVRKRTTGIIEEQFKIQNTVFHIFDVGGQRNERKKWIHCFENVTAVIFVASLSAYNEVLIEDENVNVMYETLNLFEEICNSRWFVETAFILFLNKRDLFYEKYLVNRIGLEIAFPDFVEEGGEDDDDDEMEDASAGMMMSSTASAGEDVDGTTPLTANTGDARKKQHVKDERGKEDRAIRYIRSHFEAKNHSPKSKQIFTHVTCATDRDNVEKVFNDVQHIVINSSLHKGGLL